MKTKAAKVLASNTYGITSGLNPPTPKEQTVAELASEVARAITAFEEAKEVEREAVSKETQARSVVRGAREELDRAKQALDARIAKVMR